MPTGGGNREAVADALAPLLLAPPHPNPCNPQTTLSFNLPAANPVELSIHDARGRRLRTLLAASLPAGPHACRWNGRDAAGAELPSGVYFCRLVTPAGVWTRSLTVIR